MEAGQRVSGWSRAALWFGVVTLVLATLAAILGHLSGNPWWEHNDPVQAQEALRASTTLAVALVAAATVFGVAGGLISLVGIRQYLVAQIVSPGTVIGLGRAFAGMLLSGFSSSVLVYAALKQLGRSELWGLLVVPAGLTILTAARACW